MGTDYVVVDRLAKNITQYSAWPLLTDDEVAAETHTDVSSSDDDLGRDEGRAINAEIDALIVDARPNKRKRDDVCDAEVPATLDDFWPDALPALLRKTGWAMLTAENPEGAQKTDDENANLMGQLRRELDDAGLEHYVAEGHYTQKENSLLVLGIGEDEAFLIGKKYRQDSVLTRTGLLFMDGSAIPATGVTVYEHEPEGDYTRLPETGALFQVKLGPARQRSAR